MHFWPKGLGRGSRGAGHHYDDDDMNVAGADARTSRSEMTQRAMMTWLLDSDPSIRWQVLADLVGASPEEIDAERACVAVQGWGAHLLAAQSTDGRWADALYSPKWTSTTYTLLLLHWLGLPPTRKGSVAPSYIRCATRPCAACGRLWQWSIQMPGLSATNFHQARQVLIGPLSVVMTRTRT